jgi:hypothetical protein
MAATALITALGQTGADFGDAQVANRKQDLVEQNVQSEIAARSAQTSIAQQQMEIERQRAALQQQAAGINFKDPSTGKWKRYNPVTMKTQEMPEGFDPTYDPAKDPLAIIKRAESALGHPLDDSLKQRLIAGATGVHLPTVQHGNIVPDKDSPTGYSKVFIDSDGNETSRQVGVLPPPAFAPTTSSSTQTDPMGLSTVTNTTRTKNLPGLPGTAPATSGSPTISALPKVLGSTAPKASPTVSNVPAPAAASHETPPAKIVTIPNQAADNAAGASAIDTSKLSSLEQRFLPMAEVWAKQGTKPPEKYVPYVENVMAKTGLVPFTEETAAYKNARSAIRDVLPVLEALKRDLEPRKNDNNFIFGPNSSIKQRGKYLSYTIGGMKPSDPIDADVMQLAAFSQVAGAAPWAKIGRGKYVYEQIQKHLPNAESDNAANMYDKVNRLIPIFKSEMERSPSNAGVFNWASYGPITATGNNGNTGNAPALKSVVQSQTPAAKADALINQAMKELRSQQSGAGAR